MLVAMINKFDKSIHIRIADILLDIQFQYDKYCLTPYLEFTQSENRHDCYTAALINRQHPDRQQLLLNSKF